MRRARSHGQTYAEYRRLIQLLLWRNPLPPDGTLVLKCPTDNDCLPDFIGAFPEGSIVQLHRDPFRTVTSSCRIQQVINQAYLADEHHPSDADYLATVLASTARAATKWRASRATSRVQRLRATAALIHREPAVARYVETFDVPAERERMSSPRG